MNITDTPAFKKWFGYSAAIDRNRQPMVFYHGTRQPGHTVLSPRVGLHAGTGEAILGTGLYFSTVPKEAAYYAGEEGAVYPVYLRVEAPFFRGRSRWSYDAKQIAHKYLTELRNETYADSKMASLDEGRFLDALPPDITTEMLRADGYDGVVDGHIWMVLDSTQVKSATGNRGTFDPHDADIRHNPATARRTHPALWQRIVDAVTASDKGGRPGQWSARKAQLAVLLYKKQGGGYIGPKSADNALTKWTREKWRTRSGRPSLETGERYLPAKAIAALSPQEYGATTRAKRAGMAVGQQFVPQPEKIAAKTARYRKARRNSGFSMEDFGFFPTDTTASPIALDFRARGRNELEAHTGVMAPIFDVYSILKEPEPEVEAAGFYTAPYMKGIREVAWAVVAPDAKTAAQATTIGKRLIQKMVPRTKLASHQPLLVGYPLYVAFPGGVVRIEPAKKR